MTIAVSAKSFDALPVGHMQPTPSCFTFITYGFGNRQILRQLEWFRSAERQSATAVSWESVTFQYFWENCGSGDTLVNARPVGTPDTERTPDWFREPIATSPSSIPSPFEDQTAGLPKVRPFTYELGGSIRPIESDDANGDVSEVAVVYTMFGQPGIDVYNAAKAGDITPLTPLVATYLVALGVNPANADYTWIPNNTGAITSNNPKDWDFIFWVVYDSVKGGFQVARVYDRRNKLSLTDEEVLNSLPESVRKLTVPSW